MEKIMFKLKTSIKLLLLVIPFYVKLRSFREISWSYHAIKHLKALRMLYKIKVREKHDFVLCCINLPLSNFSAKVDHLCMYIYVHTYIMDPRDR